MSAESYWRAVVSESRERSRTTAESSANGSPAPAQAAARTGSPRPASDACDEGGTEQRQALCPSLPSRTEQPPRAVLAEECLYFPQAYKDLAELERYPRTIDELEEARGR